MVDDTFIAPFHYAKKLELMFLIIVPKGLYIFLKTVLCSSAQNMSREVAITTKKNQIGYL